MIKNLAAIAKAAGTELSKTVKTTVILTDLGDFADINRVYAGFFTTPYPARACYEVKALPKGAAAGLKRMNRNAGMTLTQSLTRHLKNPERFLPLASVARPSASRSDKRFSVFNPSTGELLAELPDMGAENVAEAIDKAHTAQADWAELTARERSDVLSKWHQLILENSDDLAAILTAEMGKPLAEAKSEVTHAAAYLQWFAEEANRIYDETISAPSTDRRMLVTKQPIGVVGAITP
ncbi:delta 1-pyrroline-5-carboxylate dehydrogenase [Rhizobium mongolense]